MVGQRLSFMLQKIEKPIIARITGFCFGWALELALACDFRFCLDSTQFGLIEAKFGINPAQGGITNLTRNCGISVAKDVAMTGRKFDGNEAYRLKIVNGVAKSIEELDAMIKSYTDELIDTAPLAVGLIKRSVDWMYGQDTNMGLEIEALVNSILMNTKDMKTSGVARMQKKKPEWTRLGRCPFHPAHGTVSTPGRLPPRTERRRPSDMPQNTLIARLSCNSPDPNYL